MKVVCITGKARHGKDTLAGMMKKYLEEKRHRVLITHFGDLLKYVCEKFFDWDGNKDKRGRALLQYVGTDVIRTQAPDFWIDFVINILKLFPDEWDFVLIPDCRFPNEFEDFKNEGFDAYLIRINRPDFDSGLTEQQMNHISETSMDNYTPDFYVLNDSTIEAIELKIPDIIKSIGL